MKRSTALLWVLGFIAIAGGVIYVNVSRELKVTPIEIELFGPEHYRRSVWMGAAAVVIYIVFRLMWARRR